MGNIKANQNDVNCYYYVYLYENRKRTTRVRIHKLVAIVFIANPKSKQCVDHIDIDNDKSNNYVSNLKWSQENNQNLSIRKDNRSGIKVVSWHKQRQIGVRE